jgi:hypothetical protein
VELKHAAYHAPDRERVTGKEPAAILAKL